MKLKRILSLLTAVVMVSAYIPQVFAEDAGECGAGAGVIRNALYKAKDSKELPLDEPFDFERAENTMWVILDKSFKDEYTIQVTAPGGSPESVANVLEETESRLYGWVLDDPQPGDYTIDLMTEGGMLIDSKTITLVNVEFRNGANEFKTGEDMVDMLAVIGDNLYEVGAPEVVLNDTNKFNGWSPSNSTAITYEIPAPADGEDKVVLTAVTGMATVHKLRFTSEEGTPITYEKDNISFEDLEYGYSENEITEDIVYVMNMGNSPVQLEKPGVHAGCTITMDNDGAIEQGKKIAIRVKPNMGLNAGQYTTTIYVSEVGYRLIYFVGAMFNVVPLEVTVAPPAESIVVHYGESRSAADIKYTVTDKHGRMREELADSLGITITSAGFDTYAPVSDDPYPYTIHADYSGTNYIVSVDNSEANGVKVIKTEPIRETVNATGITDGDTLSESQLTGQYKNPYNGDYVNGTFAWADMDIELDEGVYPVQYIFTPNDTDNYEIVRDTAEVIVSPKTPTELSVSSGTPLTVEYDGTAKSVDFVSSRSESETETVYYRALGSGDDAWTTDAPTDAGAYDVKAELPETDDFAAGSAYAVLTILPRQVAISYANTDFYKTYDGSAQVTFNKNVIEITNKIEPDDVSISNEYVNAVFDSAGAGENKVVTVTIKADGALVGDAAHNYTIGSSDMVFHTNANIYRRTVNLKLNEGLTKEYGAVYSLTNNDFELGTGFGVYGLVEGETKDDIHATLYSDGTAADAEIRRYPVTATIDSYSNYQMGIQTTIGFMEVTKATVQPLSVSAGTGLVGNTLVDPDGDQKHTVQLEGTFANKNNHEIVNGTLTWADPAAELELGTRDYAWIFTPADEEHYNSPVTGTVSVTSYEKPVGNLKFILPDNLVYDGTKKAVTVESELGRQVTVEYRMIGGNLERTIDDQQYGTWTAEAPVNAGTYEVRASVEEDDDYAANSLTVAMIIARAIPEGSVSAGEIDRGGRLADSKLTAEFTGIDGELVTGQISWSWLGSDTPSTVVVQPGISYEWVFNPENRNYDTVKGSTEIDFKDRIPEGTVIYNLPGSDYAYVTVDGENVIEGDTIAFYSDSAATDPVSEKVVISVSEGQFKIMLDDDALTAAGGEIYAKLDASNKVESVSYKPELSFNANAIHIDATHKDASMSITPTDDSYIIESVVWDLNDDTIVRLTPDSDGKNVNIEPLQGGKAQLMITAVFTHPDENVTEKITVTKTVEVTVADLETRDFKVDGSGKASVTIYNNGVDTVNVILVSATYDSEGKMLSVKYVPEAIISSETKTIETDSFETPGETIKAFLWYKTYRPVQEFITPE
ncbi:MAG: hypothetical protein J1G06_04070 [Oscillospiraceae bacterium]|nr:hypothetical protein [Oscillospiraceae bacterium]